MTANASVMKMCEACRALTSHGANSKLSGQQYAELIGMRSDVVRGVTHQHVSSVFVRKCIGLYFCRCRILIFMPAQALLFLFGNLVHLSALCWAFRHSRGGSFDMVPAASDILVTDIGRSMTLAGNPLKSAE